MPPSVTVAREDEPAGDGALPMLPGSAAEPVGPEDALGLGPKRGDYADRVPGNPTTVILAEDGGAPIKVGGQVVDYTPISEQVDQRAEAQRRGDVAGRKGGVDTPR
jgi:hypothetical protein